MGHVSRLALERIVWLELSPREQLCTWPRYLELKPVFPLAPLQVTSWAFREQHQPVLLRKPPQPRPSGIVKHLLSAGPGPRVSSRALPPRPSHAWASPQAPRRGRGPRSPPRLELAAGGRHRHTPQRQCGTYTWRARGARTSQRQGLPKTTSFRLQVPSEGYAHISEDALGHTGRRPTKSS